MNIRSIACDVCGKDGTTRHVWNIEGNDIPPAIGAFLEIVMNEPSGWERGQHRSRTIRWHFCGHPCLAKWFADQAEARPILASTCGPACQCPSCRGDDDEPASPDQGGASR